jgi:hypothetical protein
MFITEDQILSQTGAVVTLRSVQMSQTMVETYCGRVEAEIDDPNDRALLAQATMFQAIYIEDKPISVMTQAALKSENQGLSNAVFDTAMFSPFMSPWAVKACSRLSWVGSRSIKTGKAIPQASFNGSLAWTHDIGGV